MLKLSTKINKCFSSLFHCSCELILTNGTSLQSVSTSISVSLMKNKINISFQKMNILNLLTELTS